MRLTASSLGPRGPCEYVLGCSSLLLLLQSLKAKLLRLARPAQRSNPVSLRTSRPWWLQSPPLTSLPFLHPKPPSLVFEQVFGFFLFQLQNVHNIKWVVLTTSTCRYKCHCHSMPGMVLSIAHIRSHLLSTWMKTGHIWTR